MQWCLCGPPGASMYQAQPASWPVSLPSQPASTTRSSTLAWAPNSERTSPCCYRAHEKAGRSSICKTSNPRQRPCPHWQHFLSRSGRWTTKPEIWTNTILTATLGSTALLRLLRLTHRRSSPLTCPHTLKHQNTGVTGSEDMWLKPRLELLGEIESIFVYFGLAHVNKLNRLTILIKLCFTPAEESFHFQHLPKRIAIVQSKLITAAYSLDEGDTWIQLMKCSVNSVPG